MSGSERREQELLLAWMYGKLNRPFDIVKFDSDYLNDDSLSYIVSDLGMLIDWE